MCVSVCVPMHDICVCACGCARARVCVCVSAAPSAPQQAAAPPTSVRLIELTEGTSAFKLTCRLVSGHDRPTHSSTWCHALTHGVVPLALKHAVCTAAHCQLSRTGPCEADISAQYAHARTHQSTPSLASCRRSTLTHVACTRMSPHLQPAGGGQ